MKKHLLFFILSVFCVLNSMAQIDIYKGTTNNLSYNWSTYVSVYKDSTGGPVTPYEGNSQYVIKYNSTSGTWGGGIDLVINGAGTVDFTPYTYLVIAWRGTSATANSLSLQIQDNNFDGSRFVKIANTSNSTSYEQLVIPLANLGPADTINWNNIKALYFSMSNTEAVGTWYLDNIYVTNTAPTTAVEESIVSMNVGINPNPSSGIYSVNTSENIETIIVSDCLGNIVSKTDNFNTQINLTNQPDGVYFVKLSNNGKVVTKKLIKSRD